MARQKGTANLAASLEVLAGAPLDARSLVDTVADLTVTSNFPYPYVGMTVTVKATGDKYVLMALPVSQSANWKKQGGSDITVDDTLSNSSVNPVQNKVITNAIANKADLVDGKIPSAQLPSYVDDVINGYLYEGDFYEDDQHTEQIDPEEDKIYVDLTEDKTYRWSGLEYVEVGGGGVALGETASTAYRGDRGKIAYDISQTVGDVANLQTTEKSTVVGAINEARDFDTNTNRPQKGITPISDIVTPLPGVKPRVMKYSTEEQIVGEWIDGKPLYQKVILAYFGSITTDGQPVSSLTDITSLNIDFCQIISAVAKFSLDGYFDIPCAYQLRNGGTLDSFISFARVYCVEGNLILQGNKASMANCPAWVVLQYTKVTD